MKLNKIIEGILNNLSERVVVAKTHKERRGINKIAYSSIRELFDDPRDIKYWDDYYQTAKYGRR